MSTPTRSVSEGSLALHRDQAGRLVLTDPDGQIHVGVEPIRSFPITEPNRLISIVGGDGRELTCISDLAALPQATAELIRQELADREFLPRIERIVRVQSHKDPSQWEVITDRGAVRFLLRDDDIRRLGPTRAILVDMHGVRYYIPDSRELDPKSRRILTQYL